jgi:hypothetical protein
VKTVHIDEALHEIRCGEGGHLVFLAARRRN